MSTKETIITRIVYKMEGQNYTECVAFMPELKQGGRHGSDAITCYAHIGQHGSAAPSYMDSLPDATLDDSQALRDELHALGYRDRIDFAGLKQEFRLTDDGDAWGTCMQWWFACADTLCHVRGECVPSDWSYSPGIGDGTDDHERETLEACETETIVRFGNLLCRYSQALRHAGRDY